MGKTKMGALASAASRERMRDADLHAVLGPKRVVLEQACNRVVPHHEQAGKTCQAGE